MTRLLCLRGAALASALAGLLLQSRSSRAEWSQFHGNAAGSGFNPVVTRPAEKPTWWRLVGGSGRNLGRSPVVGRDGTVYISLEGTESELVAYSPWGDEKWRAKLDRFLSLSTPAVGPDGNLYVIGTATALVADHRGGKDGTRHPEYVSQLISFTAAGQHRWTYRLPPAEEADFDGTTVTGFMDGSPRVRIEGGRTIVFLEFFYRYVGTGCQSPNLLAIDGGTGAELARHSLGCVGWLYLHGGSDDGLPDPVPPPSGVTLLPSDERGPTASVSLVDTDGGVLVLAASPGVKQALVGAARWSGSGFAPVWTRKIEEYPLYAGRASPAVYLNGALAIGPHWSKRMLFLPADGQDWGAATRFSSGVIGTPASSLRQIYGATLHGEMFAIDSDGAAWLTRDLGAQTMSSPAMSWNHVFINSADGIHTFNLLLEPEAFVPLGGAGTTSPAIADNGMVFVLAGGFLFAFGELPPVDIAPPADTLAPPNTTTPSPRPAVKNPGPIGGIKAAVR